MECPSCHRTGFSEDELGPHTGTEYCQTPISTRALREHVKYDECEQGLLVVNEEDPRLAQLTSDLADVRKELARVAAIAALPAPGQGTPSPHGSPISEGHHP